MISCLHTWSTYELIEKKTSLWKLHFYASAMDKTPSPLPLFNLSVIPAHAWRQSKYFTCYKMHWMQQLWVMGTYCLACQCARKIFQNPFDRCFEILLNTWLPTPYYNLTWSPRSSTSSHTSCHFCHKELLKLRRCSIDESLAEISTHSSTKYNQHVFKYIMLLKRNFQEQ